MAEWTTIPPTEAGYYWWRRVKKNLRLAARPLCLREHPVLGLAWHNGIPIVPTADGEWWPDCIESPDEKGQNEDYPDDWIHCTIHLNPKTGEMNSDGDHQVRHWIQERIDAPVHNEQDTA